MKSRLAPLSARKLIVSAIVIAAAIMVVLLVGFHHHETMSEDTHCLLCLMLSAPVLLIVAFLFRIGTGRTCFRFRGDRPITVSEYRIALHLLRAPPPAV